MMPEEDYPKIEVDGKTYYQVACRKCEKADRYKIFYNAEELRFVVMCECGKQTRIQNPQISDKPYPKAIPLHYVV